MTLASNALQAALYARLATAVTPTPVYDFVPQGSAFPYVVLGEETDIPADTKSKDGQEFTVQVHSFTKAAGKKSLKTLMGLIHAALHDQVLTLTGFTNTVLRVEFTQVVGEPGYDGDSDHYFHGVQRVRAVIHTN